MGGGARKGTSAASGKRRNVANGHEITGDINSPVTMSQVNTIVAKNDKAMQVLIENYRRSSANTPLWLSTTPYYKKDSMLVVNFRDERTPLAFLNEVAQDGDRTGKKKDDERVRTQPGSPLTAQPPGKGDRISTPTPQATASVKSFAVSGGDAASRLGLRIGSAADAQALKPNGSESVPVKQPEMAFVGNVKNLGGWDSNGLDTILLSGTAPPDPLTINSDPLWGAEPSTASNTDQELQTMLTMLRDLAPVELNGIERFANGGNVPGASSVKGGEGVSGALIPREVSVLPAQGGTVGPQSGNGSIAPVSSIAQQSSTSTNPSPLLVQQAGQASAASIGQGTAQQYYYFVSPQGIPLMAQVPPVPPNQIQYMQQLQQMQMQQMLAMNPQQYFPPNQVAQAGVTQQRSNMVPQQQVFFQPGIQMMQNTLARQQVGQQSMLAAQLQQQQQLQQQIASQQKAALAAQQLLSKGASTSQSTGTPSASGSTSTSAQATLKSPNPNARPFQPPPGPGPGEKRFNVEAAPFIPPGTGQQ